MMDCHHSFIYNKIRNIYCTYLGTHGHMDRAQEEEELRGTVVHHQGVEGDKAGQGVHLDLVVQLYVLSYTYKGTRNVYRAQRILGRKHGLLWPCHLKNIPQRIRKGISYILLCVNIVIFYLIMYVIFIDFYFVFCVCANKYNLILSYLIWLA